MSTADPLDTSVAAWWKSKANEIYTRIPDFGAFVVKANSEGQPRLHRQALDAAAWCDKGVSYFRQFAQPAP